ncbi:MAG TPA: hypothetical protein VK745_18810 [Polyangiaceae bacterium]|jgi:hypothetical protein|nr:hypothetical protein [Polyangiaceae bacterium]
MALTVSARQRFQGPSASTLIRGAAVFAALGVALSITDDYAALGKWLAVIGVVALIVGLHRFGRLGPDAPIRFEEAPTPRKKKKKKKRQPSDADSASAPADDSTPRDE